MQCSDDISLARSRNHNFGSGTVCEVAGRRSGFWTTNRNAVLASLANGMRLAVVCLCFPACSHPQLIQNSKLNEYRIHDAIERSSYASGLSVSRPLSVEVVDRHALREIFGRAAIETKQSQIWAAKQDGYSAMGFDIGEAEDPYEHIDLLSRSVGGLYLPRTQTLYVVNEPARSAAGGIYLNAQGDLSHDVTLAHEIIHALQHQHYPGVFEPKEQIWQEQEDAAVALQAATEGDANLWSAQSVGFMGRPRDPDDVIRLSKESEAEPLSDAHFLVRERIMFPYTYGYRFAHHEGRNGMKSPPASTEQVIHIGTSGRSPFEAIDLSSFAEALATRGCRLSFQDTMGELTLSLWLRSFDPTTDQQTWEGWDGDRWIAATCGNSREVAWLTSWDTEQDAVEFARVVSELVGAWRQRARLTSGVRVERMGRDVFVVSDGIRMDVGQVQALAHRARVATRDELLAHFKRTGVNVDRSVQTK
ncbi:protein of unknown function [Nitrospira japonica]|uniref:DUF4157 domain-containing protein n=1 Tax=Nitrospira japonica TaxID=1325564 RepID=A0A1W1I7D0_9BACT|nr:protein of unknown function [Nitrospira japonica]